MISSKKIIKVVKKGLPSSVLIWIQRTRRLLRSPDPRVGQNRGRFESLNKDTPAGTIVMRPGMVWAIDPESREPFTWFCWRSPPMVEEFDRFLAVREKFKRFLDIGANHGVYS